jgi:type I restriction-modification system DNA methylase subunit
MARTKSKSAAAKSSASLGFEAKLWLTLYRGRIYDRACGSGRRFVQSEKFVEFHT